MQSTKQVMFCTHPGTPRQAVNWLQQLAAMQSPQVVPSEGQLGAEPHLPPVQALLQHGAGPIQGVPSG